MIDFDKVVKGLEQCGISSECIGRDCPYWHDVLVDAVKACNCTTELVRDALALLKEQEPKTGHWIDSAGDNKCSACGATYSDLYPDYQFTHYCPNCGAKMIV